MVHGDFITWLAGNKRGCSNIKNITTALVMRGKPFGGSMIKLRSTGRVDWYSVDGPHNLKVVPISITTLG